MSGTLERAWQVARRLDAEYASESGRVTGVAVLLSAETVPFTHPSRYRSGGAKCEEPMGKYRSCRKAAGHSGRHLWWSRSERVEL